MRVSGLWPWDPSMNKPEKFTFHPPKGVEALQEGEAIILRNIVDVKAFRKIAAKVLANRPKPKKGESILRDLAESRLRGGGR